jgi:arabinofuranosyltransferase
VLALVLVVVRLSSFDAFVQDDAYISLRYARNLVEGHGLVFNPGERVEGYSNFSWTLMMAGSMAAGLDALRVQRIFGAVCGAGLVVLLPFLSRVVRGHWRPAWDGLAALFLSTSITLGAWSGSGLEAAFFSLSGWLGFLAVVVGRPWLAAGALSVALLTRPEAPLFVAVAGLYVLLQARFEQRHSWRSYLLPLGAIGAVLVAYHGWRLSYFGYPFPNTYYVKGAGGLTMAEFGWLNIQKLWAFDYNGTLILLAPLALIPKRGRSATAAMVAFVAAYLLYQIKVGGDQLPLFRLHLTALPAQMLLAARALEGLHDLSRVVLKEKYLPHQAAIAPILVALLAAPMAWDVVSPYALPTDFNTVRPLDRAHGEVGRYLQEHSEPGDIAVAQDMGVIPWHAPDVVFVDVMGLVDETVALVRYANHYSPYVRYLLWPDLERRKQIQAMDAELRDYVNSRNPRWFVVNVDIKRGDYKKAMRSLEAGNDRHFRSLVDHRDVYNILGATPDFRRDFAFVEGWDFSNIHFLLLYERKESSETP